MMRGYKMNTGRRTQIIAVLLCVIFCAVAFCGCGVSMPWDSGSSPDIVPHLISQPEANPERPINSKEERAMPEYSGELTDEQYRQRISELYSLVVDLGYKPVFAENDPVKPVYDAAIAMLDKYVLNSWHDSEKGTVNIVHTIHDWLISEVEYDFELYEKYLNQTGDTSSNAAAFNIDGVLMEHRAVCDGISRAMAFLCGIEGIQCYRVTGTFAGSAHAWNKVKIGDNWYNVDVTADSANYSVVGDSNYKKQIAHGYMLVSDDAFVSFSPDNKGAHSYEVTNPLCSNDYDYFEEQVININGTTYSRVIKTEEQLQALFEAIGKNKSLIGKVEVKLDFEGKQNVNNGDLYVDAIKAAYEKIKSPDFTFSATQKPYFQYPNGVYLFLIYK